MQFRDVELEIVRPGPPHNQPLNELTQYMALCGENSPITFTMPFEHAELLSRLDHLRYFVESADGRMVPVGSKIRESTLGRLGIEMGALLNDIRSLGTELASVRPENWRRDGDDDQIAHLRIVLSGSELAILPFELAVAPDAMPGEGQELFLQSRVQIVPTREIRRSRPLSTRLSDFHRPKVLFAFAAPGSDVPAVEHLRAIRSSLDPWVGKADSAAPDDEDRPAELKRHLRVLPNASLHAIEALCEQERFSHVHILAHGDTYREAGQDRWGVALCSDTDPQRKNVVSGKRLAHALSVESTDRNSRSAPFWVTLATCDSGNQGSVMVPGGSIAHDLHTSGIPWVLASQFPLTKTGSVHLTRLLYDRLFSGDDPRQALYETRKRLYTRAGHNHDWASLVTYASVPDDFEADVAMYFADVSEAAINRTMRHIDRLFSQVADGAANEQVEQDIEAQFGKVEERLAQWEDRIPRGGAAHARTHLTLFHGITGSVNKRLALHRAPRATRSEATIDPREARNLMMESRAAYKRATDQWAFDTNYYNWVASQYLSTTAVLGLELDESVLAIFRASTERTMEQHPDPGERAWARASRAEGDLLDFHDRTLKTDERGRPAEEEKKLAPLLEEIINTMGRGSFHVESTRRQFERYARNFDGLANFSAAVTDLARRLAKILEPR